MVKAANGERENPALKKKFNFFFCIEVCLIDHFMSTAKGLSHTYTRVLSPPNSPPIQAAT